MTQERTAFRSFAMQKGDTTTNTWQRQWERVTELRCWASQRGEKLEKLTTEAKKQSACQSVAKEVKSHFPWMAPSECGSSVKQ